MENESATKLLEKQVIKEIKELNNYPTGTEEKKQAVDNVVKLMGVYNDEKEKKKDRIVKAIIGGCEILLPLGAYIWLAGVGYKFEETGCLTSRTLQRIVGNVRPK